MPRLRAVPPWLIRFFLGAVVGVLFAMMILLLYPSGENVAHPGPDKGVPTGGEPVKLRYRSFSYTGATSSDDLTLDDSEVIIGKIAVEQALAEDIEGALETIAREKKSSCKDCVRLTLIEALVRQQRPFVNPSLDAAARARAETALKEWDKKVWTLALKVADTFQSNLNKADALRRIGKFRQKSDPEGAKQTLQTAAELATGSAWVSADHPVWAWLQSTGLWFWTVLCGAVAVVLKPTLEEVVGKGIADAIKKKHEPATGPMSQ